jgi:hypothetical protein
MAAFQEFLTNLFAEGRIVFRSATIPSDHAAERDVALLAEAFQAHALSVAGPPIPFDPPTACAAAELVRQASWALISHEERLATLKKRLVMPRRPSTPSHHLSADLTLRYLPQILKRVRGLDASDPLGELLGRILREWPLSGVLAELDEGPISPLDFGGHPGLGLLYAERLADHDRSGWRPDPSSIARDPYDLVLAERSSAKPEPSPGPARADDPTRAVDPTRTALASRIR